VRTVEFRAGKLRASPLELDSREKVEEAVYEWRQKTVAVAVPDEPEARLAALLALTEAVVPLAAVMAADAAP
jgi:hypothetical protein